MRRVALFGGVFLGTVLVGVLAMKTNEPAKPAGHQPDPVRLETTSYRESAVPAQSQTAKSSKQGAKDPCCLDK